MAHLRPARRARWADGDGHQSSVTRAVCDHRKSRCADTEVRDRSRFWDGDALLYRQCGNDNSAAGNAQDGRAGRHRCLVPGLYSGDVPAAKCRAFDGAGGEGAGGTAMMRSILAGAILIGCTLLCRAQYEGTAAAKALDHKGHDAEQNNMYAEALADFRQALALDSNYADAYTDEFDASVGVAIQARLPHANPNDPTARRQAEAIRNKVVQDEVKERENQARQHPDKPIYPWAMAQLYTLSDPLKMEQRSEERR